MKSEMYEWGIQLSKFSPRIPGTRNIDNARDFIKNKLENFGLETWLEPINFRGVFFQDWEFKVISPENRIIVSFPQNNVGFGNVEAELIDVGKGTDSEYDNKDVKKKIVLINWGSLADHEIPCGLKKRYPLLASYDKAWSHGAAALVGYFTDTPGNSLKILEPGINTTGGSNISGPAEIGEDKQFMLPVLHIGREDALFLKNLLSKGKVKSNLRVFGRRKISTVWTVVGKLAGYNKNSIVIGAHYCTSFEGAICDTVGVTGALEIAKRFSNVPLKKRPKTMYFIFSGSHVWLNCNISSLCFIEKHEELIHNLSVILWMDHISTPVSINDKRVSRIMFPTRISVTSDNPILYFVTFFSMLTNKRMPLALPLSRLWTFCEMGPFDNIGVPCMCMQGTSNLMLTTEDTWDKINPFQLYKDVSVYLNISKVVQKIPGRLLRLFEFPGRSFFGCGVLFKSTKMPEYPKGEKYAPEQAPPLLVGGYVRPLIKRK